MKMQLLEVAIDRPRTRQLRPLVEALNERAAVAACPGDSGYALICSPYRLAAVERIRHLRHLPNSHHLTLLCRSLKELGNWGQVETPAYRLMKRLVPGPYTFIVQAGSEAPKRILQPKKKSLGLRFPNSPLMEQLLELNGGPLLTTTLTLPSTEATAENPQHIEEEVGQQLDFLLDAGERPYEPTTILDLRQWPPEILRQGAGQAPDLRTAS